jgi:hypothetical protein
MPVSLDDPTNVKSDISLGKANKIGMEERNRRTVERKTFLECMMKR